MLAEKPFYRTSDNQNNQELNQNNQNHSAVSYIEPSREATQGIQFIIVGQQADAIVETSFDQLAAKTAKVQQPITQDNKPSNKFKFIFYVLTGLAVALLVATSIILPLYFKDVALAREKYNLIFKKYLSERNIAFEGKQFQYRLDIFITKQLKLQDLLASNLTWVPGHNNFSHLSDQELSALYFSKSMPYVQNESFNISSKENTIEVLKTMYSGTIENPQYIFNDSIPLKFTEKKGRMLQQYDYSYLTGPVLNQGNCGSCTMFTAVQLMTALQYKSQGVITKYSPQDLLDCTYKKYEQCSSWWLFKSCFYYNLACQGGLTKYNIQYILQHGLASESNYPYQGVRGQCKSASRTGFRFDKFRFGSCNFLDITSRMGVTAIAFHSSQNFANFYKSGIYTGEFTVRERRCRFLSWFCYYVDVTYSQCDRSPNHAVVAVGNGNNFIKVKNSWGAGWGDGGYFKIKKWSCRMCQDNIFVYK